LDKIKLGSTGKGEAIKSGRLWKITGGVIPLSKTKSSDLKVAIRIKSIESFNRGRHSIRNTSDLAYFPFTGKARYLAERLHHYISSWHTYKTVGIFCAGYIIA
jgi:hypothetical protein